MSAVTKELRWWQLEWSRGEGRGRSGLDRIKERVKEKKTDVGWDRH